MRKHIPAILLVAYLIVAISTFGRAYVNTPEPRSPYISKQEASLWVGIGCAMFWPLYWSVVAWEKP